MRQIVEVNKIAVTQTTIDSSSEYYDEIVTNYYVANDIKVNLTDHLYILNNNKYQTIEVDCGNFMYYDQWSGYYVFYNYMAKDGNYVIIDVVSGDKTVKNRYIIEFEIKD